MFFYGASDTPDFLLLVTSPLYFKARVGSLFELGGVVHDVQSLRFTSGATPTNLLTANLTAGRCSPHACFNKR